MEDTEGEYCDAEYLVSGCFVAFFVEGRGVLMGLI